MQGEVSQNQTRLRDSWQLTEQLSPYEQRKSESESELVTSPSLASAPTRPRTIFAGSAHHLAYTSRVILEEWGDVVNLAAVGVPAVVASVVRSELGVGDARELSHTALLSEREGKLVMDLHQREATDSFDRAQRRKRGLSVLTLKSSPLRCFLAQSSWL